MVSRKEGHGGWDQQAEEQLEKQGGRPCQTGKVKHWNGWWCQPGMFWSYDTVGVTSEDDLMLTLMWTIIITTTTIIIIIIYVVSEVDDKRKKELEAMIKKLREEVSLSLHDIIIDFCKMRHIRFALNDVFMVKEASWRGSHSLCHISTDFRKQKTLEFDSKMISRCDFTIWFIWADRGAAEESEPNASPGAHFQGQYHGESTISPSSSQITINATIC